MKRSLAMMLALALALGSVVASPARAASDREVAGVLIGALALVAIGKAVVDRNERRKQEQAEVSRRQAEVSRRHDEAPRIYSGRPPVQPGLGRGQGLGEPRGPLARRAMIPAVCARAGYGSAAHTARYIPGWCLERNMRDARTLPASCQRLIQTRDGLRTFFEASCLTRMGYRVEARR